MTKRRHYLIRGTKVFITLIIFWQLMVSIFHLPNYLLPSPSSVIQAFYANFSLIMSQALPTIIETLAGLFLGILLGCSCAITMMLLKPVRYWFFPILLISQALPTFAIAPLLVIWLGYGMASKIAVTVLMLFFPVASNFYDGLRTTPNHLLDMASLMLKNTAKHKRKIRLIWFIQIPYALPSLASGIRIAATVAPIGAVIGEWVGSSQGLGFLLINSNARMQIDLMFAVLAVITILTIGLYYTVDFILKRWIKWN